MLLKVPDAGQTVICCASSIMHEMMHELLREMSLTESDSVQGKKDDGENEKH